MNQPISWVKSTLYDGLNNPICWVKLTPNVFCSIRIYPALGLKTTQIGLFFNPVFLECGTSFQKRSDVIKH